MHISERELKKQGFRQTHYIQTSGKDLIIKPEAGAAQANQPCVYFWLGRSRGSTSNVYEVLYVGKAKSGPNARMKQHENGFRHSVTGKANKAYIEHYLGNSQEIFVFTRYAESIKHLGEESNGYSLEEEIFFKKYRPKWNRQNLLGNKLNTKTILTLKWPNELREFREELAGSEQKTLDKLLIWAMDVSQQSGCEFRLVRGYSGQPSGYNTKPLLVFAKYKKIALPRSRLFSIPLIGTTSCPVTILIDRNRAVSPHRTQTLWFAGNVSLRPRDLADFMTRPNAYFRAPEQ